MDIGTRIKNCRLNLGLTQEELAKKLNYKSKTSIFKVENGFTDLPLSKVAEFAKVLNTTPSYLMGTESNTKKTTFSHPDILPIRTKKIPLLGEVACGKPIVANREYELYEEVDEHIKADFCIKARGDSMIGARINNGDIVFIKECPEVCNGEIAAVVIDDSVTLKRVYLNKEKGQLILSAENTSYSPMIFTDEELKKIRILGIAVGFQSVIK